MSLAITVAERGWMPDRLVCLGIRSMLRDRLALEQAQAGEDLSQAIDRRLKDMRESPIAISPDNANTQHYEVPAEFFQLILGPWLKYSCGLWPHGVETLAEAESAMLQLTCTRAEIADGMHVLDLGCGWGALALWIAEHYPGCQVVAVSNSVGQKLHIEHQRALKKLENLEIITADMNSYTPTRTFDRVVSIEMFEHMRNYERLLARIESWLAVQGKLFVHVFCHRRYCYFFETDGRADWMARHFFTGGMMPSEDLLTRLRGKLRVEDQWQVSGLEYERTARAWLSNLDTRREEAESILIPRVHGQAAASVEVARWRLFFLACAELFGFNGGDEWKVGHYRLARSSELSG